MGHITDIMPQKKNKGRVSLFVDGEFFCGLDLFTAEKHRLKIDDEVDEDKLKEVVFSEECHSAFEKAMCKINERARSREEIWRYLTEKQYVEEVVEVTIEKLQNYKYLDDVTFSKFYIDSHKRRWGLKKIEYMLSGFGVSDEDIKIAMEEAPDQIEEVKALIEKYKRVKKESDKRKLYAYLMQKGFDSKTISAALEQIEEEENEE